MGYAEEQLIKYLNKRLSSFRRMDVMQMLDLLPCLTEIDKEQIKAEVRNNGRKLSVWPFLDTLYGRQGWVPELIKALRDTNMDELAEELHGVYESFKNPPSRPATVTSVPPAAGISSGAPATAVSGASAPSSNEPLLSPPHNMPSSKGLQPPVSLSQAPSSTQRASPEEMSDYSNPVQESECSPSSSEAAVKPKTSGSAEKKEPSSSRQSKPDATNPNLSLGDKRPTDAELDPKVASPPVFHDCCDDGRIQEVVHTTSSDVDRLARNWDGRQQHPVCVKNGYFGNRNLPVNNTVFPSLVASPEPQTSANEPEEDFYMSTDNSPSAPGVQAPHLSSPANTPSRDHSFRQCQPAPLFTCSDVIPPSSSPQVPVAPDEDLKPPIQEKKLPSGTQDGTASPWPAQQDVMSSVPLGRTQTLNMEEKSAASPRSCQNTTSRPSRDDRIFYSNRDEEDGPCKPGVLSAMPKEDGNGLSEIEPAYSGCSGRILMSSSCSLENDPLMLSDASLSSQTEECLSSLPVGPVPEKLVTSGTGNPTPLPPQGSGGDNASIRSFTVKVDEAPTPDLSEPPGVVGITTQTVLRSSSASPDRATGCPPVKSDGSRPKNSRNSRPRGKGDSTYEGLLFGFALAAVLVGVFILFKKK